MISRSLYRLISFNSTLLAPARAVLEEHRAIFKGGAQVEYVYGDLLEIASAFCLGADLGFFPREEVGTLLQMHKDALIEGRLVSIPSSRRSKVISSQWAESLAAGKWAQAVGTRVFPRVELHRSELEAWFQSLLLLLRFVQRRPLLRAFGSALLLGNPAEWKAFVTPRRESPSYFARLGLSEATAAIPMADAVDGMIGLLGFVDSYCEWESALRAAEGRIPGVNGVFGVLLRSSAGHVVRWRMEPTDVMLRQRCREVAMLGEHVVTLAERKLGVDSRDAWPDGFANYVAKSMSKFEAALGDQPEMHPVV